MDERVLLLENEAVRVILRDGLLICDELIVLDCVKDRNCEDVLPRLSV